MLICPHCGYSLHRDEDITLGDWTFSIQGLRYRDRAIHVTPMEAGILYTLASRRPKAVRPEVLLNRVSGSEDVNVISVMIHRLRAKLAGYYDGDVIVTRKGYGYRLAEKICNQGLQDPAGSDTE